MKMAGFEKFEEEDIDRVLRTIADAMTKKYKRKFTVLIFTRRTG